MLLTFITLLLNIQRSETAPVIAGFLMQFTLFVCYFSMRPIRETMGVVDGVNNLQWLFTATFVATLAVSPLIGVLFVTHIGNAGLLVIAASMLIVTALCADYLQAHHILADHGHHTSNDPSAETRLGGNPFEGAVHIFTSPLLLGIAIFVVLLASVSTFLYFEQARFVAERFTDRAEQTQFFSGVDAVVQFLTLLIQVFLTGRIASTLGIRALLLTVLIMMTAGFLMLSFSTMLGMYVVVIVIRRVGEYALVRPGREMLYTSVPTADKYKAKNFIDTVVYRGADAVSGWLKATSDILLSPQMGAVAGASIALAWVFSAVYTLRQHRKVEGRVVGT